ncbi:thermonuclease family protein [Nitrosopumilus sp. K4]|uniref:thermonuclease family protein n=1 Tax=Nitrosopumilus sp. K4 TaxID=2795383 RepID=UPI001BACC6D6|nr:thermonuclease family protein [Nitrosopumilus sp. K4]QUC64171.1 thermonuclease family protein [Nitrosopumilus sp. K4]
MNLAVIGGIIGVCVIAAVAIFATVPQDTWKDKRTDFAGVAPPDENKKRTDCLSRGGTWEYASCSIVLDTEPQVQRHQCSGAAMCLTQKVTRIVDGDTLYTENAKIRLSLVDAPEVDEAGYYQAKSFTAMSCPVGSLVTIDQDDLQPIDVYDRMVGKVYCETGMINEMLLQNGHAEISMQYCQTSEFSGESWAQNYGCTKPRTPVSEPIANTMRNDCDPSYPDVCIASYPPDLDCGEIPQRNFKVTGSDPHRFDGDGDGIGCEK